MAIGPALDSSQLCQACGLCCNGVLHSHVEVQVSELPLVSRLNVVLQMQDPQTYRFPLPCALHKEDRCTEYAHRPLACWQYRCRLLRGYEAGEVTLEQSLATVRLAKDLLGNVDPRGQLKHDPSADTVLRAAGLEMILKKHFRNNNE